MRAKPARPATRNRKARCPGRQNSDSGARRSIDAAGRDDDALGQNSRRPAELAQVSSSETRAERRRRSVEQPSVGSRRRRARGAARRLRSGERESMRQSGCVEWHGGIVHRGAIVSARPGRRPDSRRLPSARHLGALPSGRRGARDRLRAAAFPAGANWRAAAAARQRVAPQRRAGHLARGVAPCPSSRGPFVNCGQRAHHCSGSRRRRPRRGRRSAGLGIGGGRRPGRGAAANGDGVRAGAGQGQVRSACGLQRIAQALHMHVNRLRVASVSSELERWIVAPRCARSLARLHGAVLLRFSRSAGRRRRDTLAEAGSAAPGS